MKETEPGTTLERPYPKALSGKNIEEVRTTSSTGGEKGVKAERYDLIPTGPLAALARLYGKGSEKYAAHNWRKGYEYSKSYSALMRHLQTWQSGEEDIDPEMGESHLAAVIFHAMALMEFQKNHPEFDDRYKPDVISDAYERNKEFLEANNILVLKSSRMCSSCHQIGSHLPTCKEM